MKSFPRSLLEKKDLRILVSRADRIGDVLFSTPALRALRKRFPRARISVLVAPSARDAVLGNPDVDEVIVYDKTGAHRSFGATVKFAGSLRKRRFDLAIVLHPSNRQHLIPFLAGIPLRIGFNRKLGFLLTDRLEHRKQEGKKHELEYTLDVVRRLGADTDDRRLFMPLRPESERFAEEFLARHGISAADCLVAVHPWSSGPARLWPAERFARVADRLAGELGARVVIVGAPGKPGAGKELAARMRNAAIDASGRTTLSELASLIRRCRLLISVDSGPMHVAGALEVPVVAIFGRKLPGLSPRRFGPTGKNSIVFHKDAGCVECLAHDCRNGFACFQAVCVEEVFSAAARILAAGAGKKEIPPPDQKDKERRTC